MNERIKELAIRCSIETGSYECGSRKEFDYEKFAELIIQECAHVALIEQHEPSECILTHFGLK